MQQYHYFTPVSWIKIKPKQFSRLVKALTLSILIIFPSVSFAQKIEGSVRYLITVDFVKKWAAVDYLSKQTVDRLTYMYANDAEYKNYSIIYLNATQSKYEDSDERAQKDDAGYSYRKDEFTITRNYETKTLHDVIDFLGKVYIIEDTLRAPRWKMLTEMKEIAGHICMKASWNDTLKKQNVIAWYALDIQNGGGPERYFGLPGLILEVNMNNGGKIITADKIELKKLTTEMDFPKKIKGKKIKEIDYMNIQKKEFAERRKADEPPFYNIRY